jgi:hypothetical protein
MLGRIYNFVPHFLKGINGSGTQHLGETGVSSVKCGVEEHLRA